MKDEIIKILEEYQSEIDNWNIAVFSDKYDIVADKIIELFTNHSTMK